MREIFQPDEVVRLDIEYIDQWSLWLDVKILMKTFRVIGDEERGVLRPLGEE